MLWLFVVGVLWMLFFRLLWRSATTPEQSDWIALHKNADARLVSVIETQLERLQAPHMPVFLVPDDDALGLANHGGVTVLLPHRQPAIVVSAPFCEYLLDQDGPGPTQALLTHEVCHVMRHHVVTRAAIMAAVAPNALIGWLTNVALLATFGLEAELLASLPALAADFLGTVVLVSAVLLFVVLAVSRSFRGIVAAGIFHTLELQADWDAAHIVGLSQYLALLDIIESIERSNPLPRAAARKLLTHPNTEYRYSCLVRRYSSRPPGFVRQTLQVGWWRLTGRGYSGLR